MTFLKLLKDTTAYSVTALLVIILLSCAGEKNTDHLYVQRAEIIEKSIAKGKTNQHIFLDYELLITEDQFINTTKKHLSEGTLYDGGGLHPMYSIETELLPIDCQLKPYFHNDSLYELTLQCEFRGGVSDPLRFVYLMFREKYGEPDITIPSGSSEDYYWYDGRKEVAVYSYVETYIRYRDLLEYRWFLQGEKLKDTNLRQKAIDDI